MTAQEPEHAAASDPVPTAQTGPRVSRRQLLFGSGAGLAAGVAAGVIAGGTAGALMGKGGAFGDPTGSVDPATGSSAGQGSTPPQPVAVPPLGAHQAGISRPHTPQRNAVFAVLSVPALREARSARAVLAVLTAAVDEVTDPAQLNAWVLPDGVGDLTVTVGLGPAAVAALNDAAQQQDPAAQPLPGTAALPMFMGDDVLAPPLRTGDLLIIAASSDAAPLGDVIGLLTAAIPDATTNWVQHGVRGAGNGSIARNPLGYLDGIIVPEGTDELDENVWIPDGPAAGGTICVLRRLRIDTAGFATLAPAAQDATVGRHRSDGVPLSGGNMRSDVDLLAKTPEGEYLIPVSAHVRAAHPSFTGADLMLRRSYGFSDGAQAGMTFVSYQRELSTFAKTQHRLDELDAMMKFATPTASGSFLVLPGRGSGSTLGSSLLTAAGL